MEAHKDLCPHCVFFIASHSSQADFATQNIVCAMPQQEEAYVPPAYPPHGYIHSSQKIKHIDV